MEIAAKTKQSFILLHHSQIVAQQLLHWDLAPVSNTAVLLIKEQVFNSNKNKVQRDTKETEQTQAEAYVRRWYFWHYKY